MKFSSHCTRRRLLHSAAVLLLLSIAPAANALQDAAATPTLQVAVQGWTVTLRLPAAGLFTGDDQILYVRVVQGGADSSDTVPFARVEATALADGSTDKPAALTSFPGGVDGEYALSGSFPTAGTYSVTVSITPPGQDAKTVEAKFTGLTVRPADQHGKDESVYELKIDATPAEPLPGEAVDMEISVIDTRTKKRVVDFDPIYDAPLHLYVVREDIGDMRHVEPPPVKASPGSKDDGLFETTYSFPTGGNWRLFVEVAPKGEGAQLLSQRFSIPGARALPETLMAEAVPLVRQSGLTLRFEHPTRLIAHQTIDLPILLEDNQGQPVSDTQILDGALAHLYFVDRDGKVFVHALPDRSDPNSGRAGTGLLSFPVHFPKGGTYRAWFTVLRNAQTITMTFVVKVADK